MAEDPEQTIDRCVFRPDIDIEDTMNVIAQYRTGATLSYSLNAQSAARRRISSRGTGPADTAAVTRH